MYCLSNGGHGTDVDRLTSGWKIVQLLLCMPICGSVFEQYTEPSLLQTVTGWYQWVKAIVMVKTYTSFTLSGPDWGGPGQTGLLSAFITKWTF